MSSSAGRGLRRVLAVAIIALFTSASAANAETSTRLESCEFFEDAGALIEEDIARYRAETPELPSQITRLRYSYPYLRRPDVPDRLDGLPSRAARFVFSLRSDGQIRPAQYPYNIITEWQGGDIERVSILVSPRSSLHIYNRFYIFDCANQGEYIAIELSDGLISKLPLQLRFEEVNMLDFIRIRLPYRLAEFDAPGDIFVDDFDIQNIEVVARCQRAQEYPNPQCSAWSQEGALDVSIWFDREYLLAMSEIINAAENFSRCLTVGGQADG